MNQDIINLENELLKAKAKAWELQENANLYLQALEEHKAYMVNVQLKLREMLAISKAEKDAPKAEKDAPKAEKVKRTASGEK